MSDMVRCKCCGLTSSAGFNGNVKLMNTIQTIVDNAERMKDPRGLYSAAMILYDLADQRISERGREWLFFEDNVDLLKRANHIMTRALTINELRTEESTNE